MCLYLLCVHFKFFCGYGEVSKINSFAASPRLLQILRFETVIPTIYSGETVASPHWGLPEAPSFGAGAILARI